MEKNNVTIIVAGFSVILVLIIGFVSYNIGMQNGTRAMHTDMMNIDKKGAIQKSEPFIATDHSDMTMDQMIEGLKDLRGDAFDKAFIEMMIVHHQGAVDMAELIPVYAEHAELKKLGEDIIVTQTKEIQMMKDWFKTWGYEDGDITNSDMQIKGMDHSQMGM